jgi:transcription termination factor NusB
LGLEGSFSGLHDSMSRESFINEAAEIAKKFNYNKSYLQTDSQLQDKIKSWNTYANNRKAIHVDDIREAAS